MRSFPERWTYRQIFVLICLALVLSMTGCASSLPVERRPLPRALLEPELPNAKGFSQRVSSFLASVASDTYPAQDGTTP